MIQTCISKQFRDMFVFLAIAYSLGLLAGCSSVPDDIDAFIKPYQANITSDTYQLQPPDRITIYCGKIPEIDEQSQPIRPDGKISFEGLGELDVAGQTPEQISQLIRQRAGRLYTLTGDYPIDVRVEPFESKVYYVLGEVIRPGPKPYTGRDTVLQAVAHAYPEVTGWTEKIQIIRPSADKEKKPSMFIFDLKSVLDDGDTSRDVLLQEGDVVYVPPTPLAAVAMVIAEFVRPIGLALSPVYTINRLGIQ